MKNESLIFCEYNIKPARLIRAGFVIFEADLKNQKLAFNKLSFNHNANIITNHYSTSF